MTTSLLSVRRLVAGMCVLGALTALTACGSEEDTSSTASPDAIMPSGEPVDIDITITGSSVEPNGDRVSVPVGVPVTLTVRSDSAGELHVHSTPEQELDYEPGTTILNLGSFDVPGLVDVEIHALHVTVVQLEVTPAA